MNIPPQEIPKGIDYQLVTVAVLGDTSYSQLAEFEKNGWRRVPVSRHPKIKSADPKWLEQGGLALVERPQYLTGRAKVWEQDNADALLAGMGATVNPLTGRKVNTKASAERKRTIKESAVHISWRVKVAVRNKIADWQPR